MGQKRDTENRIIQAALTLFVKKGYHGTSINDITQKVGVTKGALYSHFSGKKELLIRIADEYEVLFIDSLIEAVSRFEGNPLDKLYKAFRFASRFALENQSLCVFLTFMSIELKADMDIEPILKRNYRKYQKFLSGIVSDGIRQNLFKGTLDPDLVALSFIATHDGVLNHWILNQNQLDGDFFARTFREIFIQGLLEAPIPDP